MYPRGIPTNWLADCEKICNVSETVQGKTYQIGDKEKFWVLNSDTVQHHQVDATLLYITPHSYFWAEDGASVNQRDLEDLMDTFENKIYPTDREFFGSEWTPGVDGDRAYLCAIRQWAGRKHSGVFQSLGFLQSCD